jgi:hypothetical protein
MWPATKAARVGPTGAFPDRLDFEASARVTPPPGATGLPDYTFAFHDDQEIGPSMLAKIAKYTGLTPNDL